MSKTTELSLMKRAALRAVVHQAIKSGSVKLVKRSHDERVQRMKTFLKQGGVNGREVLALCATVKAASAPSQRTFEKVAKASGLDVNVVKLAYMVQKRANLGTIAGGGLGALGGFAMGGPIGALAGGVLGAGVGNAANRLPNVISHAMNPYQMSPERRALYQRIQNEAMGNQRLSQDLQAMSGAFRPAPNPWGPPGAH